MDEDAKALLAILALITGSSSGIGLFKSALDPLEVATKELVKATEDQTVQSALREKRKKAVAAELRSLGAIVYVALVLICPIFLVLVVLRGAAEALRLLGLGSTSSTSGGQTVAPFYTILLVLSVLSTAHLLAPYLKGWKAFLRA